MSERQSLRALDEKNTFGTMTRTDYGCMKALRGHRLGQVS